MNKDGLKLYIGVWYNYIAQSDTSEVIWAKDEKEAIIIMTAVMKFFGGDRYSENDISELRLVNPETSGYTLEDIKKRYISANKEWIFDNYQISEDCKYGTELEED